jgi:hypothetical protein
MFAIHTVGKIWHVDGDEQRRIDVFRHTDVFGWKGPHGRN